MIVNIIKSVKTFLIIHTATIIFFGFLSSLLFYNVNSNTDFLNLTTTMVNSFSNGLGEFETWTLSDTESNDFVKDMVDIHNILKLVVMFFFTILMMNILVATLSNIFTEVETKGKMEMA